MTQETISFAERADHEAVHYNTLAQRITELQEEIQRLDSERLQTLGRLTLLRELATEEAENPESS